MTPAERMAALLTAQNALDSAMAAAQADDRETSKEDKR